MPGGTCRRPSRRRPLCRLQGASLVAVSAASQLCSFAANFNVCCRGQEPSAAQSVTAEDGSPSKRCCLLSSCFAYLQGEMQPVWASSVQACHSRLCGLPHSHEALTKQGSEPGFLAVTRLLMPRSCPFSMEGALHMIFHALQIF